MLKVLLKKQLAEVFKGYFYDAKKNRMRSKPAIIAWFVFFFIIMVGMLGGIFTAVSVSLCGALVSFGMGWLYFLLMGGIAIFLGAFGSVFSTYSSLYMAQDNDLLLSLPIPIRTIMAARLTNVYIMGTMYSAVVLIPMLIVYWITSGISAAKLIGGIAYFLIVTIIVLLLSCLLGWVVAKISRKIRNKSVVTVFVSLLFIAGYYFVYFKANNLIRQIVQNADIYGEKIKGAAYLLYLFGRIGEGDLLAAAAFLAVAILLLALVLHVISRSFLSIASSGGPAAKVRYVEKTVKQRSATRALVVKEFARFTSSANYMLNCGLGILLLPIIGVLLLIFGSDVCETVNDIFVNCPDIAAVLFCTVICGAAAMIDIAAPSVSLEGKSIWIPQSLPVGPAQVLRAKLYIQIILAVVPTLIAAACAAFAVDASAGIKPLVFLMPLVYALFSSVFCMFIGTKMPILNWTNEIAPIKQGGAVVIVLFGGWGITIAFIGLYLLFGSRFGAESYIMVWIVGLAVAARLMLRWLDTKGAEIFKSL